MKATTPEQLRQETIDGIQSALNLNLPWPLNKVITDEDRVLLKTHMSFWKFADATTLASLFATYQRES